MASRCLRGGIDCLVISVGALADPALFGRLKAAAQDGNSRILLPAGAIGGIDAIAAMRVAGLTSVRYRSRKPPAAWRGSPAEKVVDLGNAHAAHRALQRHRRRSRAALSAERQCGGRGGAGGARLRRHRGGAGRRSRRARQCARDRSRGRRRALCDPAAGQAVAQQPEDVCAGGHERRAGAAATSGRRSSSEHSRRTWTRSARPTPSSGARSSASRIRAFCAAAASMSTTSRATISCTR